MMLISFISFKKDSSKRSEERSFSLQKNLFLQPTELLPYKKKFFLLEEKREKKCPLK